MEQGWAVCAHAQHALRGGGGGRGFLMSVQELKVSGVLPKEYAPLPMTRQNFVTNSTNLFWP